MFDNWVHDSLTLYRNKSTLETREGITKSMPHVDDRIIDTFCKSNIWINVLRTESAALGS